MKKMLIILLILVLSFGASSNVFASQWDKAGIALTGLESLRVITGGNFDPIGSVFGVNRNNVYQRSDVYNRRDGYNRKHKHHKKHGYTCANTVWVPHYTWERHYVPRHEEYRHGQGMVIIQGHYIEYKVENGGHYETQYACLYR